MDWNTIIENLPALLNGSLLTLGLVACSLITGFIFALLLTLCIISDLPFLKLPAQTYVFIIRGTPLLVQFFLIYYGTGQFPALHDSIFWIIFKSPFTCAALALAMNSAAYSTEIFVGAIRSVPKGAIEACQALGMSWLLSLRRIILPHAFRIVLPAYSNEVIMLVKASSLASTITLLDLMGVTQQIINRTYLTIEFYVIAGVIYLAINSILMGCFRKLTKQPLTA